MSISNINSIYTRLLNNLKEKNAAATAASTDKSTSSSGTGSATSTATGTSGTTDSSKADSLKLGTDSLGIEEYLNYGQLAKYSQPSLADFLSGSEDGSNNLMDIFGTDSTSEDGTNMDLNSIMNGTNSDESDSTMFDGLIQSTVLHNNQMINQAIKKYAATNSTDSNDFTKKVEAIKAEIKADMEKAAGKTTTTVTTNNGGTSSTTTAK